MGQVCLACVGLSLAALLVINRYARATAENYNYQLWSSRFGTVASAALIVGILVQLVISGGAPPATATDSALAKFTASFKGNTPDCLSNISKGNWTVVECKDPPATGTPPANKVLPADPLFCSSCANPI